MANFGLDPNYPDDWTQAELTSFDPSGMRSIATTMGSSNPYYDKAATYVSDGTMQLVNSLNLASASRAGTAAAGENLIYVAAGAEFMNIGPSDPASRTAFYIAYDPSNATLVTKAHTIVSSTSFNTNGTIKTPATAGGISNNYSTGDIPGKYICRSATSS